MLLRVLISQIAKYRNAVSPDDTLYGRALNDILQTYHKYAPYEYQLSEEADIAYAADLIKQKYSFGGINSYSGTYIKAAKSCQVAMMSLVSVTEILRKSPTTILTMHDAFNYLKGTTWAKEISCQILRLSVALLQEEQL